MATEAPPSEVALRARIARKVRQGQMPVVAAEKMQAGYGLTCNCDACDQQLTSSYIKYEFQGSSHGNVLYLHLDCFVLWQLECLEQLREQRLHGRHDGEQAGASRALQKPALS